MNQIFHHSESGDTCLAVDNEIEALASDATAFPDSIDPAVANYLCKLVSEACPQLAVEIGCCRGFSTLHIAKALVHNQKGKLVSFDLEPQEAEQRIRRVGLGSIVTFITGNSAIEGKRYFDISEPCIDFLFIDGDHTRRGCLRDAETFLPFLKVGGIVVFHDIYPERCGWLGPRYLIECLKKRRNPSGSPCFTIDEISSLDQFGIAVCQKQVEFPVDGLKSTAWYNRSRLAQLIEIANFEGKKTPLQILMWGLSKWRRIACHW